MSTKPTMRRQSFVERYILARANNHTFMGTFTTDLIKEANETFDAIDTDTCKRRGEIVQNNEITPAQMKHTTGEKVAELYRKQYWSKPNPHTVPTNPHTVPDLAASIDVILDRTCMNLYKLGNTPESAGLRPSLVLAKALVDAQQRR